MKGISIQEYLAKKEWLDEQSNETEAIDCELSSDRSITPISQYSKYSSQDINQSKIPGVLLYKPSMTHCSPAVIACYITSDDWSKRSLIELKEKTDAYLLVGLQTADSEFEDLGIIDGIIKCQPNEVNDVIKLLDVNSAGTLIGIDAIDIKSLFKCCHSFQFIQASATGKSELDLVKVTTHNIISQLEKARHTKGLLIVVESIESPSLEVFSYISEAVEALLSNDDAYIYYSASITDELDCFRLKALYASA